MKLLCGGAPPILILLATLASLHASTTWTNPGTGSWSDGSNWNNDVPTAADSAILNDGTVQIASGVAQSSDTTAGNNTGSATSLSVSGPGTEWDNGFLYLGNHGDATLSISNAAVVNSSINSYIGLDTASVSSATVSGAGSQWNSTGVLYVGAGGQGTLSIDSGAVVTSNYAYIASNTGSHGSVTVTGSGSQFTTSPTQNIFLGAGSLSLSSGGYASTGVGYIGDSSTGPGTLTVVGSGSEWDGGLVLGYGGNGVVNVANGGTVNTPGYTLVLGGMSGLQGTLNIGLDSLTTTAGTLSVPNISSSGTGIINFNQTDATSLVSDISGNVYVNQPGSGITRLSGSNTYTGATAITGGTFLVNGTHIVTSGTTSAYSVSGGGILGGTGTINLSAVNRGVTIGSAGKLSPGDEGVGTLTLSLGSGGLNVSSAVAIGSGEFLFDLASPAASDRISLVSGILNLGAGGLDFSDFSFTTLAGFADGTYTLFDTNSPITGVLGSNLTGMLSGQYATIGFSGDGQDVILTVSSVPEPTTGALIAGWLLLFVPRWISRKRATPPNPSIFERRDACS